MYIIPTKEEAELSEHEKTFQT